MYWRDLDWRIFRAYLRAASRVAAETEDGDVADPTSTAQIIEFAPPTAAELRLIPRGE